jgi:hypothetical protein
VNKRELFQQTFFTCAHVPVPVPLPVIVPVTTIRHSAYRYGPDRVDTFSNSQFFVSIFNLTKKLVHFVMGGSYVVP